MPALEPELQRLYAILRDHPEGLREYELLALVRGDGPLRGLDELALFRVHFLLFHHLHRLRVALERAGSGSLEIHCLRVRLLPLQAGAPNPEALPAAPDPLAAYYLELGNLSRTTREEVQDLLRWFWRRYSVHGREGEALEVLGLSAGSSPAEIRRRYRSLVRAHHPDRGGDGESFRRVVEAMQVLRALSPEEASPHAVDP